MWADLGFWREDGDGMFHIHGVTGPDEYTTVVNDNLFTNVMARFNLQAAARVVRTMAADQPEAYARLVDRLDLHPEEVEEWAQAAEMMTIPYDETTGVHPQDSHFLEREVWDLANTPADRRPLLLYYHPLVIYRFQVVKQADVVLALFLQGDHFTLEEKKTDFDYYDPITTGDSTLSGVVQSIIAAEVGYHRLALKYFVSALFVDLADLHHNASDGVHVASTGGVWTSLVFGFGGMRDYNGDITFDPRLPDGWDTLVFRFNVRGNRAKAEVSHEAICFELEDGEPFDVAVRGETVRIGKTADSGPPRRDGPEDQRRGRLLDHRPSRGRQSDHRLGASFGSGAGLRTPAAPFLRVAPFPPRRIRSNGCDAEVRLRRRSDGQNWTVIITGHRGARAEAPENTLDGFAHAAAIGLESVEFDVRMSADGQLVVMHDAASTGPPTAPDRWPSSLRRPWPPSTPPPGFPGGNDVVRCRP